MMNSSQIRQTFLDFFRSKGHQIVPSAPMVVKNDPTLMFNNSGMAPFKEIFLGHQPAKYKRVADTQKCLRVSGKHNDLEEVGVDTYHHTMFEMLGNWSFGDYFKKEAIAWAWELLTDIYKLPKDRLYVTVFEGDAKEGLAFDQDAYDFWKQHIAEERILRGNKKDNFWEMGDQGPCGPCSEIHVDLRDEDEVKKVPGKDLVNVGHPQVVEIWNNVFMEFNRKADGSLEQLPAKHVDTGMGFERLCMALQKKKSNYDTDVFQPMIQYISEEAKIKYGSAEKTDIAMRVMADHIRAISFAIADGQLPSNVKAGYVIRRILRRAVRYAYSFLNLREPFLCRMVGLLADQFKEVFPELKSQQDFVARVIMEEEASFLKTLENGIYKFHDHLLDSYRNELGLFIKENMDNDVKVGLHSNPFDVDIYSETLKLAIVIPKDPNMLGLHPTNKNPNSKNLSSQMPIWKVDWESGIFGDGFISSYPKLKNFKAANKLDGKFAFELYDTYGFPIDLTQLMAREENWTVDMVGFDQAMNEQKNRSRKAANVSTEDWVIVRDSDVEFTGYDSLEEEMELVKYRKVKKGNKEQYQLVFNRTPFYAESGGQVGDTGVITANGKSLRINDTQKENNLIMHFTDQLPDDVSATFIASVDGGRRRQITKNHSATHLLHAALKQVLGKHVNQKGSLVNEQHTRFDFSHFAKVSDEELAQIEKIVNEKVRENIALMEERNVPIQQAMEKGAMALFGEKYGDFVRVITFDPKFSVELCGGTHVNATGEIGYFKIMSESSVAAGVRRVEAITGSGVEEWINEQTTTLGKVKELLKNPKDIVKGVELLLEENQSLKDKLDAILIEKARQVKTSLLNKVSNVNGVNMIVEQIELPSADLIKNLSFDLKNQMKDLFLLLGANIEGKPHLSLIISENLVGDKSMDATKIIRTLAKEIQGGGGGQPFYATAGGKQIEGLKKALEQGRMLVSGI